MKNLKNLTSLNKRNGLLQGLFLGLVSKFLDCYRAFGTTRWDLEGNILALKFLDYQKMMNHAVRRLVS